MFFSKTNKQQNATYIVDSKTKRLLTRIKPNQVAVIMHQDIDEIAANGLIEKKVKIVINFSSSITNKYPSLGLKKLLEAKVAVYDVLSNKEIFNSLTDNKTVQIYGENDNKKAIFNESDEVDLKQWGFLEMKKLLIKANENIENELNKFIDNTLEYAAKEKDFVLKPLKSPKLRTKIKGKHVVVVVRGNNYREDLQALRAYIEDYKPILIGVDGGADALIEYGFKPHIIIGDMDSVTDNALKSGTEVIIHAYPDGRAPGLDRVKNCNVDYKIIPALGTSEDVAMLVAYEEQAEIIVALGTHSNMVDFLEKGRKGMASTVLVRMKIGTKLIDAKGVSKLYQPRFNWKTIILMGIAAITPIIAIGFINKDIVRILKMVWLNIKMFFV